jgi:hypothetical protein
MSFWTDATLEDPKRVYRWILMNGPIDHWICKNVTKPHFTISNTEHKYINFTFNYPGGVTWSPVKLTLVDPVNPDAAMTMMSILQASGYKIPNSADQENITTISKQAATTALGTIKIKQIGADGDPVETWELYNAWISDVDYGTLDYDSDELSNITLEIRYDFAILKTKEHGGRGETLPDKLTIPDNFKID